MKFFVGLAIVGITLLMAVGALQSTVRSKMSKLQNEILQDHERRINALEGKENPEELPDKF